MFEKWYTFDNFAYANFSDEWLTAVTGGVKSKKNQLPLDVSLWALIVYHS